MPEAPSAAAGSRSHPYHARLRLRHVLPVYWPAWLGIALLFVLHRLPRRWLRPVSRVFAGFLERYSGRRRRIALRNLELCFPDASQAEREQRLHRYFLALARSGIDYGLLWFGSPSRHARHLEVVGEEHFVKLREQGIPIIVLAPHSVALDHGGLRMSQMHEGVAFTKPLRNPVAEWINFRSRTRYSGTVFTREQGLRPVIREIRRGRFFYYLPDEDLGPESAVFAEFFGVRKATLTALGRLVSLTGARVLPSFTYYDPDADRYVMRLWPPLANFPSGDAMADAQTMNRAVEMAIRVAPEHYLWGMKIFRTRPADDPDPDPYREGRVGPLGSAGSPSAQSRD